MKLTEYKNYVRGKRVSVIGMGISNAPLAEFLNGCGAIVTARDKKTPEELGRFFSMVMQNMTDRIEQKHEEVARLTLASLVAAKTELIPEM